jgi:hypothetical protein
MASSLQTFKTFAGSMPDMEPMIYDTETAPILRDKVVNGLKFLA